MSLPTDSSVLCLSDLHGSFYTLTRLLNVAPKGVQLVFAGDLVDRGPHSRKVVEFAMKNGIPTCAGNHEDLLLAFYHRKAHCADMYDPGVWLDNGGQHTLRNWPVIDKRGCSTPAEAQRYNRDQYLGGRVPDDVLDWMEGLPPYLFPSKQMDENGRQLLVSHSGYGLNADNGDWFSTLWGHHLHGDGPFVRGEDGEELDDNLFRVFGHSRLEKAIVAPTYAAIDSGAAYKAPYGTLSALLWPSKVVLTQRYDESPVKPKFTIQSGGLLT